jgi:hypothetical protein
MVRVSEDRRPLQAASPLRSITRAGLWIGAAGSLAFTLYAGRSNNSALLVILFAIWVLLPFAGLWATERVADRSPTGIGSAMRASALVIMICSLAIYGVVALSGPSHHKAFAFLAVPGASWLAILPLLIAPRFAQRR